MLVLGVRVKLQIMGQSIKYKITGPGFLCGMNLSIWLNNVFGILADVSS